VAVQLGASQEPSCGVLHLPRAEAAAIPGQRFANSGGYPATSKADPPAIPFEPGPVSRRAMPAAPQKAQNSTATSNSGPKKVLRLSAIIGSKDLPQDLPSVGSARHGSGHCKPCAFIFTKGCVRGIECEHCHLCESGEKKRRQKLKIEWQRKVRKLKQKLAQSTEAQTKAQTGLGSAGCWSTVHSST